MKEDFLHQKLLEREANNALRSLRTPVNKIDFCSNDYLGLARRHGKDSKEAAWDQLGSGGSRLLAGNYPLIEDTERVIADFHETRAGLIFNSGYDANLGLLSCVPRRGDTILYDQLSHASIRDGIRLSFAQSFSFLHNDLEDLEKKIKQSSGNIFVVTESVFSMEGDMAPLKSIVELTRKWGAFLIIDEAHATGVIGNRGEGLVQALGLQENCFARIHTFGKAVGCHGAIVLGSELLRDYLLNFSRPFIYTTALPPSSVSAIKSAYELFPKMTEERAHLNKLIAHFQAYAGKGMRLVSFTPIQGLLVPGNEQVRTLSRQLQEKGLDVRPILYPTVPKGGERLRIVLHAYNTEEELHLLLGNLDLEN